MYNFLFKSWLLTEVFSSAFKKQQRQYDRAVANRIKQLNRQVKYFKNAIKEYPDDEKLIINSMANFLINGSFCYDSDEINYMLTCLYHQGFTDLVIKITERMVNEFGAEYL